MNINYRIIFTFVIYFQCQILYGQNIDFKWAVSAGGRFNDASSDVTVDNSGNSIAIGYFSNTAMFGNIQLNSAGSADIFVAKYDPLGNLLWAAKAGGPYYDEAISVTTDNSDNIIITGKFSGSAAFGSIIIQGSSDGTYPDVFIAKYDPNGNCLWVKKGGGDYGDSGEDLNVDEVGNIYVSGIFTLSATFDNITLPEVDAYGTFIAKYDPSGNIQWVKVLNGGTPFNVYGFYYSNARSNSIVVNNNGIYVSGSFTGYIVIANDSLVSEGDWDTYLAKFNMDGSFAWAKQIKGGLIWTFDTEADQSGNLYLTGVFETKASFDNIILTTNDSNYVFKSFIAKYNQLGDAIWVIQDNSFGWSTRLSVNNSGRITVLGSLTLYNNIYISQFDNSGNKLWYDSLDNRSDNISGGIFDDNNGNIIISGSFTGQLNFGSLSLTSDGDSSDIFICKLFNGSDINIADVSGDLGQIIKIKIAPPQDFNYTSVQFFYRKNGERIYQRSEVTDSANSQFAVIPADYSTIRGIQYYVVFSDGESTITFPKDDPINHPASIQVKIPEYIFPLKPEPAVYEMISAPLSINNPALNEIFENNYGIYNKNLWRLFRWDSAAEKYAEFPEINSKMIPGNAFWLINSKGKSFLIKNAYSLQADSGYTITLHPGWNQVGNPFAFPVAWESIQNSKLVQSPITWNMSMQDYELNQNILQPWTGYWIFNPMSEDINLIAPQIESPVLYKNNSSANYDGDEFVVQIKAAVSSNIHDYQNFVGMQSKNWVGNINQEILKPPPVNENLRFSIDKNGKELAQEFVPFSKEGAYWDLKINSNLPDRNVELEFEKKSRLPEDFKIWFFDKQRMLSIPVVDNHLNLQLPKEGNSLYRLIIGNEEFAKNNSQQIPLSPSEYTLYQNYPNPFNLSTNIMYNLREKSKVTIEIYDILGKRINMLVMDDIQNPGLHNIIWNGKNSNDEYVSSGIYIYQIKANDFTDSKMMVMLK
jgi:hypothetical protein